MFGILFGTACLAGFIKVARGRRGHWGRRGGGRQWMLRRLFERLDTTPGQEKVVLTAVDEVEKAAWGLRDELRRSRTQLAEVLRGESFNDAAVREAFARHQAAGEAVQKAVLEGLQSTHQALEPRQRRTLAELVVFGPRALHGRCEGHHGRGRWESRDPGGGESLERLVPFPKTSTVGALR